MTESQPATVKTEVKGESSADANSLENVVYRLLDKAGRDPRCTLKLLRDKVEKRMSLETGALKAKREEIKQIILNWWDREEAKEKQQHRNRLAALVKLAKASGHAPAIFKGVKELSSDEERAKVLSQKLIEKGLKFTDPPTEEEIEAAKKAYELKKDMEGIDPSAIIESGKRRNSKEDAPGPAMKKKASTGDDDKPVDGVPVRHNLDLDEEADF